MATYQTSHQRIEVKSDFTAFTTKLENLVGRFDIKVLALAKSDPQEALRQLQAMKGEQDLILFETYDHGALLNILGHAAKAKQYLIGNALTASTMTKHDIRAALYAPLRILVSEQEGRTIVEFDLAENSFGQFKNEEVTVVARSLDQKMSRLLARADESTHHYGAGDLTSKVTVALEAAHLSDEFLSPVQLEPLDQFHVGGAKMTAILAAGLSLKPDLKVLDIGCGLGGPARAIAIDYGCEVTGIDLTPQFIAVAKMLSRRVRLSSKVTYEIGDALNLPYEQNSFDRAYSQHVAMNIEDRDALYAEVSRVLKPGGLFGIYDVIRGNDEPVIYPTPWAATEATSFLLLEDETKAVLHRQGFDLVSWTDCSEEGIEWFKEFGKKMANAPKPVFGLPVVMGPEFSTMTANFAKNLNERRVRLVRAIFQRK